MTATRTVVLHLRGDVDFFTEDGFRAEAELLLAEEGLTALVVDLAEVDVMDSSGLGLLIDLLRLCRELGIEMTLRAVPERVQQLIDITGLGGVLRAAD